jgi:hypothetical protein
MDKKVSDFKGNFYESSNTVRGKSSFTRGLDRGMLKVNKTIKLIYAS